MGRPALNKLKAVTSTYHLMMKFPTEEGVGVVRGDQLAARKCYNTSMKKVSNSTTLTVASVHEAKGEPAEPLEEVSIGDGRTLQIGTCLEIGVREDLVKFLHNNTEVFAWSHEDMPGINPEEIVHVLNVNPDAKPVKQKRRKFAPERVEAITVEVEKLLKAQFIEEVHYPEWLANVVLVKKSNGKWRMCIDFTDLNKACPKDSFPLPRIDALVDSTSGYGLLSFMDAFSGYNQILMHPQDREKTAFITDRGLYCYKVMPFGLKNAGATYQRLVNKMFQAQIGRNMEVYVDDMLVKSKESRDHIRDLHEAFATLKQYGMKLNPSKCAFGVSSGKFLGYMVSSRGIEANPEKIRAVLEMQSPKTTKQLQQLTGRLAALNRFISRSTDKCLPFFKILRKAFEWSDECEEAFSNLKAYLTSPPLLSRTIPGEVRLSRGNSQVGVTAKYKYRTSPGIVRLSRGGLVRYAFKLEKASSHSSDHSKAFLRILKKGRHLSVEREMNLFNAASRPVSCCSCFVVFGDCISRTARIFSGLASIPLLETIYPRNFPEDTPKAHFEGFNFIPYCFSVAKAS
jgi:hypothetical protein